MSHTVGPIKDFALGIFDGPHATPAPADSGPIFLGIKNVTPDGRLDLSEIRHVSLQQFPKWTRRVTPQEDDIVFSYEATLHLYARIPQGFEGCLGRRMALVRPARDKVDPRFLLYYFLSPGWRGKMDSITITGATVNRIPLTTFPDTKVSFPSLAEQQAIAQVLCAYDDLIENNRRRIALLEQSMRLLYREWFVHLRFPGHEHVKIVDGVPAGWERRHLADVVSTQYGHTASADNEPVGPKFLRGTDINKQTYIDWSSVPYCSEQGLDFDKYALRPGDILVIRMADPGKVALVEKPVRAVFASYLVRLKVHDPHEVPPLFLFQTLSGDRYQRFIAASSGGSTRKTASAPLLTDFHFILPPRVLLELYLEQAQPIRELITKLVDQSASAAQARDLLLPRLMNGEIAV